MKILIIEDNVGDARLIREYLGDAPGTPFTFLEARTLAEGLTQLEVENVDLVLLDLSLPDSFGLDTFARMHRAAPHVPFIVMSGRDDEALAIQTVHEGAQDYLVKSNVDARLLNRSIRYAIERKRSEEKLAYERDLFHQLLDNLPDRIYFKDRRSRFIRINQAVADQFRLGHPREVWGRCDADFFTAEHAQSALADEQRVMETSEPILGKIERETLPDGRITWALTSKLPLKDQQGRTIGNFGISRDITELKTIQGQLERERNLLRSLIDNLPDYIYVKDSQGRYLLDNIAHRELVGAASEEAVRGRTVFDFFPRTIAEEFAHHDETVLQSGREVVDFEQEISDRSGRRRWNLTTKVPLRDEDRRVVGLVCISRDITERKIFEQQLQHANMELARSKGDLQKMYVELQHSLAELKSAQFQLIQAEKMQSIGRLAAGVAHEVKNPLAILRMGVDYLKQNLPSPEDHLAPILGDMTDAIQRADSIIMGLLDFSVPNALELRPEDANDLIEQSLTLVRHWRIDPPIQVNRELAPQLPPIRADKNKIKQVLVNLLTNACHAMSTGGILTVRTSPQTVKEMDGTESAGLHETKRFRPGALVVCIEIQDTGPGIPADKLAKIFDPFFTTKAAGKGTGLGLTVTRKIVELHGGALDIHNHPQGGVLVTLRLPT